MPVRVSSADAATAGKGAAVGTNGIVCIGGTSDAPVEGTWYDGGTNDPPGTPTVAVVAVVPAFGGSQFNATDGGGA